MNEKAKELKSKTRYEFSDLCDIMMLLRSKDGCPWDKEQTHESIRSNFIEETYEAVEAIDKNDMKLLREELGDVMLQIVFHAEMERERGVFDINDVIDDICKKLVLRHPHVFGDVVADTSEEVLSNWDAIKAQEKERKTISDKLRSVPAPLPALMRADKLGRISRKAGFDFTSVDDAFDKIGEEAAEVKRALSSGDTSAITDEIGDLLLAVVNTARLAGVESERALNLACEKYIRRFEVLESELAKRGLTPEELTQAELDAEWDEAKKKCAVNVDEIHKK
ncbi:MAG TPA: nucleoside triphosphate pyrophosphohydrolase [Bacillota bacterium]|nr:nucleoside triphosphate pyrophosphohydrolase [Clostridiales bacterium]HOQ14035.1 nucleoside triphosphate pyrophosphohydrolase [Bacillota bacterium]